MASSFRPRGRARAAAREGKRLEEPRRRKLPARRGPPRARDSDRPARSTRRAGASRPARWRRAGRRRAVPPAGARRQSGSRLRPGSSSTSTGASGSDSTARARRWRVPPESFPVGRVRTSTRSHCASTASMRVARQAAQPRVEREDLGDGQTRVEARRLRQERQLRQRRHPRGHQVRRADHDAPGVGRRQPAQLTQRRRLAAAVGADEQRDLARAGDRDRGRRGRGGLRTTWSTR